VKLVKKIKQKTMNHKNIKKVIVFDLETKYDEANNKAEVMV
jgi:hypothetical protein